MKKLFLLKPEVAGGLGDKTVITNYDEMRSGTVKIPHVSELEYVFDDWLGDDLLESTPCFIVTDSIANHLKTSILTGYSMGEVAISTSGLFSQLHDTDFRLPKFFWLIVHGSVKIEDSTVTNWSAHDFCSTERAQLVVTERCLNLLKQGQLKNCEIIELN